jgi:hypothetical protein
MRDKEEKQEANQAVGWKDRYDGKLIKYTKNGDMLERPEALKAEFEAAGWEVVQEAK